MRQLVAQAQFERARQEPLCADDFWAGFRACHSERDEIVRCIRSDERSYRETAERKEEDWVFVSDFHRASYWDGYDALLRFDVKDIARRMDALGDKIDAINWLPRDRSIVEMMLQNIYRQRIQSLKHLLEARVIRWAQYQTTDWRGVIPEIMQEYVMNGLAASLAAHHLHDLSRRDKDLEIFHVTPL